MTKIHVIKDETLGGIEREYLEVDRKAEVGDFITRTLEPTDVVHVWETAGDLTGLVRYRLVDRKAEVGEKVLITDARRAFDKYKNGDIILAEITDAVGICNSSVKTTEDEGCNEDGFIADGEYRVLVPVANEAAENCCEADACVTESEASPQVIDMLANLSRRIVALERKNESLGSQLTATQRNVETLARELEGVKHTQKPSSAQAFEALARHEGGVSR